MATDEKVTIARIYESDLKEVNIIKLVLDKGSQQETFRHILADYVQRNGIALV